MRSVISAIIAACKTAFGVGVALLSWPFRFLFGFNGATAREPLPEVAPALENIPERPVDSTEMYRKIAVALQAWAAESLLADELRPAPTSWPRSVQEWAKGLTRDECFCIIDAPEYAVIGHVSATFAMPGVRPLQQLRPLKWQRQEPFDPCRLSPGFALSAAACEPR